MSAAAGDLGWVSELRLTQLAGIPRSTYAAWSREGLVELSPNGAYRQADLIDAVLLNAMRAELGFPVARQTFALLRASRALETLPYMARADAPDGGPRIDLVLDTQNGDVALCFDDTALLAALRPGGEQSKRSVVIPLAAVLRRAVRGFANTAEITAPPLERKRGRPRRRPNGPPPLAAVG